MPGRAATALNAAGVRWALLREAAPTQDEVDILLEREDVAAAERALGQVGWRRVPSWGRGDHHFFRGYDAATDSWSTLDLVDELAFGSCHEMRSPVAGTCLSGRAYDGEVPRLGDDDAFWTLLLHCLLDRQGSVGRHTERLTELADHATTQGPVPRFLATIVPPTVVEQLLDEARSKDFPGLRARVRPLRAAWYRAAGPEVARRRLVNGIGRRCTKLLSATRRRGIEVALLGPDGAGKTSVSRALLESYPQPARRVYGGHYGRPVRYPSVPGAGLAERLLTQVGASVVSAWHRRRGRLVVFDRHAYDALVRPGRPLTAKARARRWALAHLSTRPHLVVILDAPAEVLWQRSREHSVPALDAQRRGYLDLAARLPHGVVVDADREPDDVRRDVTDFVWRRCADLWSRTAPNQPFPETKDAR